MMHIAVKTFIHNTDFPVIFPSRWTLGQLLSHCIPWQRSDVSSSALHFQTWKYKISHMELILKFHVCSRPFDDESSLWSTAQNVLDLVSPLEEWVCHILHISHEKVFHLSKLIGKTGGQRVVADTDFASPTLAAEISFHRSKVGTWKISTHRRFRENMFSSFTLETKISKMESSGVGSSLLDV